jgi:hypothetical protein
MMERVIWKSVMNNAHGLIAFPGAMSIDIKRWGKAQCILEAGRRIGSHRKSLCPVMFEGWMARHKIKRVAAMRLTPFLF